MPPLRLKRPLTSSFREHSPWKVQHYFIGQTEFVREQIRSARAGGRCCPLSDVGFSITLWSSGWSAEGVIVATIITVHGTNASGPEEGIKWWQKGSEFEKHIHELVESEDGSHLTFQPHIWAG